jgi:small subunit ribosomal protein S20
MPHRHAALKSLRKDAKRTLRNRSVKSRLRTEQNKFDRMLERGDMQGAETQLVLLTKLFQRAAARNVIHANRAARKQAQFQRRLNQARAGAAAV